MFGMCWLTILVINKKLTFHSDRFFNIYNSLSEFINMCRFLLRIMLLSWQQV